MSVATSTMVKEASHASDSANDFLLTGDTPAVSGVVCVFAYHKSASSYQSGDIVTVGGWTWFRSGWDGWSPARGPCPEIDCLSQSTPQDKGDMCSYLKDANPANSFQQRLRS